MNREIYILGETVLPPVVRLEAGEKRSAAFVVPRGVSGSFEVVYELAGEGAELDLTGVYACCGEQKVDFCITVRHLCAGCVSHQLFKGLAEDEARVKFEGLVYVAAGAEKTEALQENHSLLLSERLYPHLREIDEAANNRLEQMMPELMKSAGVTEALKASDPMKWVGLMNTLKAQAEETILTELVFS